MNKRRRKLVNLAFDVLDKDRSGEITYEDVQGVYNAKFHAEVLQGFKSEEEVIVEFLNNFEVGGVQDGIITRDEFQNYYANISASIDDDDYFELMIRNAWHISGGEGAAANTTNRRVLVTHPDGRQTIEEIKNDIGIGANDTTKMAANLRNQGISAAKFTLDDGELDRPKGSLADAMQARKNGPASPMPYHYSNMLGAVPTGTMSKPQTLNQDQLNAQQRYREQLRKDAVEREMLSGKKGLGQRKSSRKGTGGTGTQGGTVTQAGYLYKQAAYNGLPGSAMSAAGSGLRAARKMQRQATSSPGTGYGASGEPDTDEDDLRALYPDLY